MKSTSVVALLTFSSITALAQDWSKNVSASAQCIELNQIALTQAANGHVVEAETSLALASGAGGEGAQGPCIGYVLNNMAALMSVSGRLAEAERLAEQSVRVLEKFYQPTDRILLRPLQILAAARLEAGKTARAREAVKRMLSIRINGPDDSALVHGIAGTLLQIEARNSEAEAEYVAAFRAWEEAGRSDSADAAGILCSLGSLYLEEQRLDEARRVLDNVLGIYSRAKDVVPMDRIKFLDLRGVLHSRLGDWGLAQDDLLDALSMVDREPFVDPLVLRSILNNYSRVLRKTHHGRDARSIEARAAALPPDRTTSAVVDLTDLLVLARRAKK
jgi:tetratricopeptide (TPR) repeat protein